MRATQQVAAALLITAIGIAGCSKSDNGRQAPPQDPEPARHKPVVTTPPASLDVKQTDGEGFVASVPPRITGTFADGEAAYQARKYADATAIFEGYTERRPANPWGHYMLGLSAWKNGDLSRSEQAFEKALSIDPHHVKSLVNLSRVFISQKRHEEAVDRLVRASEIEPESAEVFRLLGRTYYAQRKIDEAVDAYRQAIELNERDAWSLNNLGLLLLEIKRADEALPLLASAVQLRKDVPEFHNNLGMALEHTGRFKAAATAYGDALNVDQHYDKARQNLARVAAVESGPEEPFDVAGSTTKPSEDATLAGHATAIK
jgi:tetratricopeptide (TPR) repeat protein